MFRRNVGGVDRVLRVTLGAVLFLSGLALLTGRARLGVTLAVVGLLALVTGIVRFCALYIPFGISTAKADGSRMGQMCDCAPWMKQMQGEWDPDRLPAASQKPAAEERSAVHR